MNKVEQLGVDFSWIFDTRKEKQFIFVLFCFPSNVTMIVYTVIKEKFVHLFSKMYWKYKIQKYWESKLLNDT